MFGNRVLFSTVATTLLAASAAPSLASVVAADSSSNYGTYGGFNGANNGTGFGSFNIVQTGTTGGSYVDSVSAGGFTLYDNGTQQSGALTDRVTAFRPFTGALASNQMFSADEQLRSASDPTNGGPSNLGFSLVDSAGTALFDFHISGGGSGYVLSDGTQTLTQTTVIYNYAITQHYSFTLNNALTGAYTFTVTGNDYSNQPYSQTFTGTVSTLTGGITQAAFFNNNGGYASDFHFDNLAISNVAVPEPLSLGAAGLLALPMLRRRRA